MADQFTEAPAAMTPQEIQAGVFERLGFDPQQAQSFGYNVASDGTPTYPKSRRQMRMDEDFRKLQQEELQNQRLMQQMELNERAELRLQKDQDIALEKMRMDEDREERVQNEAGAMISSIRGAIAPDGTTISNPIRPDDPDAIERLDNLARDFKFGIENKLASSMFDKLYGDALRFREDRIKESEKNELVAADLSVRTGRPFGVLELMTSRGCSGQRCGVLLLERRTSRPKKPPKKKRGLSRKNLEESRPVLE
jgi:hypothetical protein